MTLAMKAAESRILPDRIIRAGIRRQLRNRLESFPPEEERRLAESMMVEKLKSSPVALSTQEANEQHYEVPADFFMPHFVPDEELSHPLKRAVFGLGKNLLGAVVFLAGVAMLFIPGQGLLTMLLGLALIDFPGKRAMEIKLVRMPKVHGAMNWVRRKYGREPLQIP